MILGLTFFIAAPSAFAASASDLSAFMGIWKINPGKTTMGRNGPTGQNTLRSATFTFAFVRDDKGPRMDVYSQYPQPAPTRSQRVVTDGTVLTCESKESCLTIGGDPKEQTYEWFPIDSHMLVHIFWVKGREYDHSTMSVSTDGKTMTLISWAPETPQYENIQVFEKQR